MRGAGGTAGGIGTFLPGLGMVVVGGYLLLFDTLIMLGLFAAGLGLVARLLRAQGETSTMP